MAWPSTAGPAHVATALNSNGANIPPCDTPVRNPCDQLQKMDSYVASETTPIVPSMTLSCDGTMVRGRSSLLASFVWGYFAHKGLSGTKPVLGYSTFLF